jgi:hypothetical protein
MGKILLALMVLSITVLTLFATSGCASEMTVLPEPAPPVLQSEAKPSAMTELRYVIVDTGQNRCYDNSREIACPEPDEPFYGQDGQYRGNRPSYKDNADGTVTDLNTELMWQKNAGSKITYQQAVTGAASFNLAGYRDWRLPTIKELYSLIVFSGVDPSGQERAVNAVPFIDTNYFAFKYGDPGEGDRIIDAQYATSTVYVGNIMVGAKGMFGVNFADGRIKGYPTGPMPGQIEGKKFFVLYVRGYDKYGLNNFIDNGDGTVTDSATGLMWSRDDSGKGMDWKSALEWAQQKNRENYLGHNDWRLPDAKELQSIVDYSRAPSVTNSAAISSLFRCSTIIDEGDGQNYPFYWSSTTHSNIVNGSNAAYVAFGEGLGWMRSPPASNNFTLMDVHGAGCQRSDPKTGEPSAFPRGHGPQGDVIRIFNYVRLVRNK